MLRKLRVLRGRDPKLLEQSQVRPWQTVGSVGGCPYRRKYVTYVTREPDSRIHEARFVWRLLLRVAAHSNPSVWLPPEQITGLASKCAAQLIENIRPMHSRAIVVQPEQRGIGHTRFFSQAVQGPPLLRKDLSKPASDHASRVAGSNSIWQLYFIYQLWFTLGRWRSRLFVSRKRLGSPSLQWKTTINLRAGALRTSPGFPVFAAKAQP
jgi:hypothetical protein